LTARLSTDGLDTAALEQGPLYAEEKSLVLKSLGKTEEARAELNEAFRYLNQANFDAAGWNASSARLLVNRATLTDPGCEAVRPGDFLFAWEDVEEAVRIHMRRADLERSLFSQAALANLLIHVPRQVPRPVALLDGLFDDIQPAATLSFPAFVKWRSRVLLADQPHQQQVLLALTSRCVVQACLVDPQQIALYVA
jgi:tetratricopeptide (TPR) repeat protein